jgi:hypothetical protein
MSTPAELQIFCDENKPTEGAHIVHYADYPRDGDLQLGRYRKGWLILGDLPAYELENGDLFVELPER